MHVCPSCKTSDLNVFSLCDGREIRQPKTNSVLFILIQTKHLVSINTHICKVPKQVLKHIHLM